MHRLFNRIHISGNAHTPQRFWNYTAIEPQEECISLDGYTRSIRKGDLTHFLGSTTSPIVERFILRIPFGFIKKDETSYTSDWQQAHLFNSEEEAIVWWQKVTPNHDICHEPEIIVVLVEDGATP